MWRPAKPAPTTTASRSRSVSLFRWVRAAMTFLRARVYARASSRRYDRFMVPGKLSPAEQRVRQRWSPKSVTDGSGLRADRRSNEDGLPSAAIRFAVDHGVSRDGAQTAGGQPDGMLRGIGRASRS